MLLLLSKADCEIFEVAIHSTVRGSSQHIQELNPGNAAQMSHIMTSNPLDPLHFLFYKYDCGTLSFICEERHIVPFLIN